MTGISRHCVTIKAIFKSSHSSGGVVGGGDVVVVDVGGASEYDAVAHSISLIFDNFPQIY